MRGKILIKKRITTWTIIVFSLAFLSRIVYSEERENFRPKLSIKITGGMRYMMVGDINTYLQSFDDYLVQETFYMGGNIKKISNFGTDFEGELRVDISSKFAVGVGIGYIFEKNKSSFETVGTYPFQKHFPESPYYWYYFIIKPRVKAVPLKFGIYYTLPLSLRMNLFLNGGFGYYFSKASLYIFKGFYDLFEVDMIPWAPEAYNKFKASSNGPGFHGGIGFKYNISKFLSLELEIQGRYARITNLKGERHYELGYQVKEEEGLLYIGNRDLTDEGYGEKCPDLIFSPSKPVGNEFQNMRKAVLDFSGLSLRIGLRLRVF